jgi:hypothetical protein
VRADFQGAAECFPVAI